MHPDAARLKRLHRLERVRDIARHAAAAEAARAEGTLTRLAELAERTGAMAASYAARTDMTDGGDLTRFQRFTAGLQGIRTSAENDAQRARTIADQRQAELATAERRRAAVEDRADALARSIAARAETPALGARRAAEDDMSKGGR